MRLPHPDESGFAMTLRLRTVIARIPEYSGRRSNLGKLDYLSNKIKPVLY